jgi:hypothetical protein
MIRSPSKPGRSNLSAFPDAAIEEFLSRGAANGSGAGLPGGWLQAYGGAITEVPDEETAFGHRQTLIEFGVRSSGRIPPRTPTGSR